MPVVDALPLGDAARVGVEEEVAAWLTKVSTRSAAMINGLIVDMQQPAMADAIAEYNALVAAQNAAWAARFAPISAAVRLDALAAAEQRVEEGKHNDE